MCVFVFNIGYYMCNMSLAGCTLTLVCDYVDIAKLSLFMSYHITTLIICLVPCPVYFHQCESFQGSQISTVTLSTC